MLSEIASLVIGYLLGAIPAAYLMAKLRRGIDIREVGVHNMGAANVMREVGIWEGGVVAAVDLGKGYAAIVIAQALGVSLPWVMAAGFAAILGHNYPVFLGFRGGKGVATVIGIIAALSLPVTAAVLCAVVAGWLILRHAFTTFALVAPVFPLSAWFLEDSLPLLLFSLVIVLFIAYRTRARFPEIKVTLARFRRKVEPGT